VPELSIVIPTLGRADKLGRTLDRLADQQAPLDAFDVVVVADAFEPDVGGVEAAAGRRPYPLRVVQASRPGASAARNAGWKAADSALLLFLDDDVLALPALIAEHLAWHADQPEEVGVLGHVGWASELRVTPFMRWLEHGVQFDYPNIQGVEAGWGRFYTANASVKRSLVERVGGFAEDELPFGYEDLDIAYRMNDLGFRLLYNRSAAAEHLHPMTLEFWVERMPRIATSEYSFTRLHPELPPYFHAMFEAAAARPRARGRLARLARWVPPSAPVLGPRIWACFDIRCRQALAPAFLAAWRRAEAEAVHSG